MYFNLIKNKVQIFPGNIFTEKINYSIK